MRGLNVTIAAAFAGAVLVGSLAVTSTAGAAVTASTITTPKDRLLLRLHLRPSEHLRDLGHDDRRHDRRPRRHQLLLRHPEPCGGHKRGRQPGRLLLRPRGRPLDGQRLQPVPPPRRSGRDDAGGPVSLRRAARQRRLRQDLPGSRVGRTTAGRTTSTRSGSSWLEASTTSPSRAAASTTATCPTRLSPSPRSRSGATPPSSTRRRAPARARSCRSTAEMPGPAGRRSTSTRPRPISRRSPTRTT